MLGNIFAGALMRKRAQQAEEESEQRFRYLFEEAPIGIAIENVDGKILFANPALCSILGYDMNEIVGMNCCQFSDADAEGNDWDQFQELRSGLADTYRVEKRYTRKDGTRIWGRVNVTIRELRRAAARRSSHGRRHQRREKGDRRAKRTEYRTPAVDHAPHSESGGGAAKDRA